MEKRPLNPLYYRSLTRNMVLTICLVSVLPLIIFVGILLFQFDRSYHIKVRAHLGELVQKHRQQIDDFLAAKQADIRFLARTFTYEELARESFLQDRLFLLQQEYGEVFVDLGVIDNRGIQVAYAGPFKLAGAHYGQADWFQKAMQSQYFISDVFLGLRGLPHFIVAVRENWNGRPWILRATIDFVAFNHLVENIRIGETGFAFILNKAGDPQTKPLRDIAADKPIYMTFIEPNNPQPRLVQIFETRDHLGKKNIYAGAPLKNGNWVLVYQQDAADAFRDLQRAMRFSMVMISLSSIAIIMIALTLSKRMVKRVMEADKAKEMMDQQIIETGKLASIGELAAGIAHEINNPIAIMVEEAGWIEDLLSEEPCKENKDLAEMTRALKQINTQGKRCKEITLKLLSFARKTDMRVAAMQLNDLIEEVITLSGQRAKYANVQMHAVLAPDLPVIRASESELQQVLLNLINNAMDAMEKTGGNITITSSVEGGNIVIEVADTGPGIPAAILPRIFDPFFTTKPVGKGTGLGLSICYGIIKKMGGDITVESAAEAGAVFRFKIPYRKEK